MSTQVCIAPSDYHVHQIQEQKDLSYHRTNVRNVNRQTLRLAQEDHFSLVDFIVFFFTQNRYKSQKETANFGTEDIAIDLDDGRFKRHMVT